MTMPKAKTKGFTLMELLAAIALSVILLIAVDSLFRSSLITRAHLDGELSRNKAILVMEKFVANDAREANLAFAQFIYSPATEKGPQQELTALALPRARDPGSNRFITDPNDGRPVWQSLRIYYVLPGTTTFCMIDLAPKDPKKFYDPTAPMDWDPEPALKNALVSADALRNYCTSDGSYGSDFTLVSKREFSQRTEWFGPEIDSEKIITSDGVATRRYSLALGLRIFYTERNSIVRKTSTVQRVIFSDNSLFLYPGPSHTPIPTPYPLYPPPDFPISGGGS